MHAGSRRRRWPRVVIGFEATAIYSEETRDPTRTIGRATYVALATISVFYVFVTWTLVAGHGAADVQRIIAADTGNFAFTTARVFVGQWASNVMQEALLSACSPLCWVCTTAPRATCSRWGACIVPTAPRSWPVSP